MQHTTSAIPMEAVGIIGGEANGLARLLIELPNLAEKDEFFADPFAQFQAEKRISEAGLRIIAIYHSHPGGGCELSESDLRAAINWDCAHIVIVPERESDDYEPICAYRILEENKVIEIPLLQT